jgi:NADH-quinone oxidoreductase subunit C
MSQQALELFTARFGDEVLKSGSSLGNEWALVKKERIAEMAQWLKHEPALDMKMLVDLAGVDLLHFDPANPLELNDPQRFELIYLFGSITKKHRLRLKVKAGLHESVPTLCGVYKTANWWERLAFDFFGVKFEGHPHLRRIIPYDEFKGHALHKDYPIHLRQPLTPERHVSDLVRGPGPGPSEKHAPFSQRSGARPNTRSDNYD